MRHLTEGALRRLYDEPYAVDEASRHHYRSCARCQERLGAIAEDARHALALMKVPGATVDSDSALHRVRAAMTPPGRPGVRLVESLRWRLGWRRPAVAGLVAAVLAGVLAFTPLAANVMKIFEPSQVTPVTITQGDLKGLDAFAGWGDVTTTKEPELKEVASASEAARISGLPEIQVDSGRLPASLRAAPVSYGATTQAAGTVTFNSKAPAKLRGSTLTVQLGPSQFAIYGDLAKLAQSARTETQGSQPVDSAAQAPGGPGGSGAASQQVQNAVRSAGPVMVVISMRAPQVSSTGVSVAEIKRELLAQPGLSPALRQAIQSIDDPKGNLPIPILAGSQVNAHEVQVQGAKATAVGDNTGLGSGVVWISSGRVYAVGGTLPEDQVLAVAGGVS